VTNRSEIQAVNPYLMVMNAFNKLQYWESRSPPNEDPVFQAALEDCERIMDLLNARPRKDVKIYMSNRVRLSSTVVVRRLIDLLTASRL
jgi:hypothetical protein